MFQIVCIEQSTKSHSTIATGFRYEIEARRTVKDGLVAALSTRHTITTKIAGGCSMAAAPIASSSRTPRPRPTPRGSVPPEVLNRFGANAV